MGMRSQMFYTNGSF